MQMPINFNNWIDDNRHLSMTGPVVARRLGAQQREQRAQALATAADDVMAESVDQHDVGIEAGLDQPVDRSDIVAHESSQIFDFRFGFGFFQGGHYWALD